MNFTDKMKEIIQKSLENKQAFSEQALKQAQRSGEKCVLTHEIMELEKDIENNFLIIGNEVYAALIKKKQNSIDRNTKEIMNTLLEIESMKKLILEKELLLNRIE